MTVIFLSEEDQEWEEGLVVEIDAHSAPLNVKAVVNSVDYLCMYEARPCFHEFVNKVDPSHQVELDLVLG